MTSINSEQERSRVERERGWMILLLYHARPRALEFGQLRKLLDQRNLPLSSRRLAEHISYLYELNLARLELGDSHKNVDEREAARAIQRYADSDRDGLKESLSLRLTVAGVNFQDGVGASTIEGIARIE